MRNPRAVAFWDVWLPRILDTRLGRTQHVNGRTYMLTARGWVLSPHV